MDAMRSILKSRNEKTLALINEWLADESGYDESVWPHLKEEIESNRLSERNRFDDLANHAGHGATGKDHSSPA